MKSNKRKAGGILKRVLCIGLAAIVLAAVLGLALALSKVIFYIAIFTFYVVLAFATTVLCTKLLAKFLRYIEQRKK